MHGRGLSVGRHLRERVLRIPSRVLLHGRRATLVIGADAASLLSGTDGADQIVGQWNDDTVLAGAGDDLVNAGYGDDSVLGGDGNDLILGEGGDDTMDGGNGADTYLVSGNQAGGWSSFAGFDTYADTGAAGTDRIVAQGSDVDIGLRSFSAASGIEVIDASAATGTRRLVGGWSADTIDLRGITVLSFPELTAALTVDYGIPVPSLGGKIDLFADYSHRDDTFQGTNVARLSNRDLTNARASYTPSNGKWAVSLWGRNLGNSDYVIATGRDFLGNQFLTRGVPRMYGVEAKVYF